MENKRLSFKDLTPEIIFGAVESFLNINLNGMLTYYNSYINRVVGLEDSDGNRLIAKFYRPDRWTIDALIEEHDYLFDCYEQEIPVVAPIINSSGETLGCISSIYFAVFPLKSGRLFEIIEDNDWVRVGALIGRMHRVGMAKNCSQRVICSPLESTSKYIYQLIHDNVIGSGFINEFRVICEETLNLITPLFEDCDFYRIHGDCHSANILDRGKEGLMIIDFDDMMIGPAVQDLWLLLPDHYSKSIVEMDLLLEGYRQFKSFDERSLKLIEPLRFMRIIYFLNWCSMQRADKRFLETFPNWGSDEFWKKEIDDLRYQLDIIGEHLDN